jgi:hypothetical protein
MWFEIGGVRLFHLTGHRGEDRAILQVDRGCVSTIPDVQIIYPRASNKLQ